MSKFLYARCLIICLLAPLFLSAQQPAVKAALDAFLDRFDGGLEAPGGVLSIEQDGKLIYERAFGATTLEYPVPNTASTIFEAGSVSKQFTATAVLLLVLDGKIDLSDDVHRYIPELPDYKAVITIEHLLTHTSGIRDWGTIAQMGGWPRTTNLYTEGDVQRILFAQRALNFSPGSQYAYSNSNYNLLRLLVERVSKQSFADFTRERLFKKAGMQHSSWRTDCNELLPGRAIAYQQDSSGYAQQMPFENTYGHAALLTTTKDLLAWNAFLAAKGFGQAFDQLRLREWVFPDGRKGGYGCGALFLRTINGVQEICHSGSTAGYRAWLAYYPEKKLSVAYLSNHAGIAPIVLARKITELFIGAGGNVLAPAVNPQVIEGGPAAGRAGIYRGEQDPLIIEIGMQGDSLYMKKDPTWNARYNDPLLAGLRQVSFMPDGSLKVVTPTGVQLFRKKERPTATALQNLQRFTGSFYSVECRGKLRIVERDHSLYIEYPAGPAYPLQPLYADEQTMAFITPGNILLEFSLQGGQAQQFSASLSQEQYAFARADKVLFKRTK